MPNVHVVGPTEGQAFDVMDDKIVVKTAGSETDGRFSLLEFHTPKDVGRPRTVMPGAKRTGSSMVRSNSSSTERNRR